MHKDIHLCTHMYTHAVVLTHTHTHTPHTHTHTHTHTHRHAFVEYPSEYPTLSIYRLFWPNNYVP
jgi:hypothetical protein